MKEDFHVFIFMKEDFHFFIFMKEDCDIDLFMGLNKEHRKHLATHCRIQDKTIDNRQYYFQYSMYVSKDTVSLQYNLEY